MKETDLYPAIKAFLEAQGYEVKSEICTCDVVGKRGDEEPVIVEMKVGFTLPLILQGVDRLAISDTVYLAFGIKSEKGGKNSLWRKHKKSIKKMCRRLGLGLISVHLHDAREDVVEVHLDPQSYTPRKNKKRSQKLLREFELRAGDPNEGGITRRSIVTAYRQDALRCLKFLQDNGATKISVLRDATGVERAAGILQNNHYEWFARVERGTYEITPEGKEGLKKFKDALKSLLKKK